MVEQQSAYSALQALAQKSLASAHQLPAQIDIAPQWSGVGFSMMGFYFVVPMGELAEMLEIPQFTRLPGVHAWVKGVANVRGRLLPLFDMGGFFSTPLVGHKKNQRLLVLDNDYVYAGLWVDQVLGMQYFPVDAKGSGMGDVQLPGRSSDFVDGYYEADGRQWFVFQPQLLSQDAEFLGVAAS